jgi:hypothetical protein
LKQVLLFGLNVTYDNIVSPSSFSNEVFELLQWAIAKNRIDALLKQAREDNPGNLKLREFDELIKQKLQGQPLPTEQPNPLEEHKEELIRLLSKLPISATFQSRTSLLDGIPGADTVARDENSKRRDLNAMLTNLAGRGRLSTGEWPVVKLIANALPDAEGFEVEGELKAIQEKLAQA